MPERIDDVQRPITLKSAVLKADCYNPGLTRTYAEMAEHYGTAIRPARPRKPRDKAKVEVSVQVADTIDSTHESSRSTP